MRVISKFMEKDFKNLKCCFEIYDEINLSVAKIELQKSEFSKIYSLPLESQDLLDLIEYKKSEEGSDLLLYLSFIFVYLKGLSEQVNPKKSTFLTFSFPKKLINLVSTSKSTQKN